MKKHIVTFVLGAFLVITPIQKSHAAIAAITTIWNAPVATKIAIAALTTAPIGAAVGFIMGKGKCADGLCTVGAVLGGMLGLVLLDESGSQFQFNTVDEEFANRLGLALEDVEVYNSEIDEVNIVFNEFSTKVNSESSLQDSKNLWNSYSSFLSPETLRVMDKLTGHIIVRK